jgi:hypothetical protein
MVLARTEAGAGVGSKRPSAQNHGPVEVRLLLKKVWPDLAADWPEGARRPILIVQSAWFDTIETLGNGNLAYRID